MGSSPCSWSPAWDGTLCRQLPRCKAPSFTGCTAAQVWLLPSCPAAHLLHPRLLCRAAEPCEELLSRGTELLSRSAPDPRPTHGQPTLLLAASVLPLAPSAVAATGLPNRCLPHRRDEDEVYDDVEPVGLLQRGQGFPLPPVSRPPAYPSPRGGGYRRGWDASWDEHCSSELQGPNKPWAAAEPGLSLLLPCTGGRWVSLLPCK